MYIMFSTPLTCSSIVGSGIDGRDQHCGRRDFGVLRHRQREHRHCARQHDDQREHDGEHRTVDEEARNHG